MHLTLAPTLLVPDPFPCLCPQSFHNINPHGDLFNNINLQFWEYWLPGAVAWGYIACTGTNFAIRVKPLAHCGWFPTVSLAPADVSGRFAIPSYGFLFRTTDWQNFCAPCSIDSRGGAHSTWRFIRSHLTFWLGVPHMACQPRKLFIRQRLD